MSWQAENDETWMFEGFRQTRNENLADEEYIDYLCGDRFTGNIFKIKPSMPCNFFL